jgi:hypothetical protein
MALKRRLVLTVRLDRTYPDNEVRLRTNDTSWLARLDPEGLPCLSPGVSTAVASCGMAQTTGATGWMDDAARWACPTIEPIYASHPNHWF